MVKTVRTLADVEADIARTKEALANVKGTETEVYARIVGYYRSVRNWNKGKRDEYNNRKLFVYNNDEKELPVIENVIVKQAESAKAVASDGPSARYEFFARKTCPNCPPVKEYLADVTLPGSYIDVDSEEGLAKAAELGVFSAPTVILYDEDGVETARAHNVKELKAALKATAIPVSA
ncbi:MAG: hypothetical protein K5930_09365 [Treponemataceae bacterium]|nr:hypothetical protein [Treponemataceae bacterium]